MARKRKVLDILGKYNKELANLVKREFKPVKSAVIKKLYGMELVSGRKYEYSENIFFKPYVFKHKNKDIYIVVSFWQYPPHSGPAKRNKSTKLLIVNVYFNEFVDKNTFKKYIKFNDLKYPLENEKQYIRKLLKEIKKKLKGKITKEKLKELWIYLTSFDINHDILAKLLEKLYKGEIKKKQFFKKIMTLIRK